MFILMLTATAVAPNLCAMQHNSSDELRNIQAQLPGFNMTHLIYFETDPQTGIWHNITAAPVFFPANPSRSKTTEILKSFKRTFRERHFGTGCPGVTKSGFCPAEEPFVFPDKHGRVSSWMSRIIARRPHAR